MMKRKIFVWTLVSLMFVLSACGTQAVPATPSPLQVYATVVVQDSLDSAELASTLATDDYSDQGYSACRVDRDCLAGKQSCEPGTVPNTLAEPGYCVPILSESFSPTTVAVVNTAATRLNPNTAYTLKDLESLPQLLDVNCDKAGYELCQALGHYGVMYTDPYGVQRIPGMFKASDGYWYVTDADTIFDKGGNTCYLYIEVAWHQSGACSVDSVNPLCQHYIARAGYVYDWQPAGEWPAGEIPVVSGYYSVGDTTFPLYCKIQK